jgi:hypothetical protein
MGKVRGNVSPHHRHGIPSSGLTATAHQTCPDSFTCRWVSAFVQWQTLTYWALLKTLRFILTARKKHGMSLADNGSSWCLSGAPLSRRTTDTHHTHGYVLGSPFEAVDEFSLVFSLTRVRQNGKARGTHITLIGLTVQ